MAFRIFDNVLVNHTWSTTGRLCIAREPQAAGPRKTESSNAEADSLLARLRLHSKTDRVMRRAGKRLTENPVIPFDELARELGVTERYLLTGLRSALGVDPHHWRDVVSRNERSRRDHSSRLAPLVSGVVRIAKIASTA